MPTRRHPDRDIDATQGDGFDCGGCAWPKSNTPVSQAVVRRFEPWAG